MSLNSNLLWKLAGQSMEAMFSACPDFSFESGRFGWIVTTGEPVADFNCAYVADTGNPEETLKKYQRQFSKLGCPFLICAPSRLGLKLLLPAKKLGLSPIGELPLMTFDLPYRAEKPQNPAITIRQMDGADSLRLAVEIGSRSFGIRSDVLEKAINPDLIKHPRISMYLASLHGIPSGIVTTTRHEKAVGIWSMVTAPEARRNGVATQLVRHVLTHAGEAETCFLLATADGKPLYAKLGFEIRATAQVWCGGTVGS